MDDMPAVLTIADLMPAAAEIFNRHVDRLVALAAARLSQKYAQRVDPEDVVQSAFRSFFREAKSGRYTYERSGDLWRLLAGININKLYRHIEYNGAAKRNVSSRRRLRSLWRYSANT